MEAVVTAACVSAGARTIAIHCLHMGAESSCHMSTFHTSMGAGYTGREAWTAWLWVAPTLPQSPSYLLLHLHQARQVRQPLKHYRIARPPRPSMAATRANVWARGSPAWVQSYACVLVPFINVIKFFLSFFRVSVNVKGKMYQGCRFKKVCLQSLWDVCPMGLTHRRWYEIGSCWCLISWKIAGQNIRFNLSLTFLLSFSTFNWSLFWSSYFILHKLLFKLQKSSSSGGK